MGSMYTISDAETPLYVLATQSGSTSIHVIWGTVQPLRKTVGYRVYYYGPTSGSVDIDDPSSRECILTGLMNNGAYTVFVAAKSEFYRVSDRHPIQSIWVSQS